MSVAKGAAGVIAAVAVVVALDFGAESLGMWESGFFGSWSEANRYSIQKQSQSYNDSELRRLYDVKVQYVQAGSDEERQAIVQMARHEASVYDRDRIPADLRGWLISVGILQ